MLALTIISSGTIATSLAQTNSSVYLGISSIPRQQGPTSPYALSSIDEVIAVMNTEHLNIWRMSFEPTFNDWQTFIQYYLDHCPYNLIVDPNHYYSQTLMTDSQWQEATQRCLQILQTFSNYQDRIWIEPQNEQLTSDLVSRSQTFVDAVRNAGFINNIVSDVFWRTPIQNMAKVHDPLNKFWTGQHAYLDQNTLTNFKSIMQNGLNAGLKIMNTEVGADAREIAYFTQTEINQLNDFLQWSADRGIGNTVWLMYGDYDYPTYQNYDLVFPNVGPTTIPGPTSTPNPTPTSTSTTTPNPTPTPTPTPTTSPTPKPAPTTTPTPATTPAPTPTATPTLTTTPTPTPIVTTPPRPTPTTTPIATPTPTPTPTPTDNNIHQPDWWGYHSRWGYHSHNYY